MSRITYALRRKIKEHILSNGWELSTVVDMIVKETQREMTDRELVALLNNPHGTYEEVYKIAKIIGCEWEQK